MATHQSQDSASPRRAARPIQPAHLLMLLLQSLFPVDEPPGVHGNHLPQSPTVIRRPSPEKGTEMGGRVHFDMDGNGHSKGTTARASSWATAFEVCVSKKRSQEDRLEAGVDNPLYKEHGLWGWQALPSPQSSCIYSNLGLCSKELFQSCGQPS